MLSGDSTGVGSATAATSAGHGHPGDDSLLSAMPDQTDDLADGSRTGKGDSQTVRIRRIFKYAGEKVMEDREVPADSAEAKLYLAEGGDTEMPASSIKSPAQRNPELIRPLRRRSRFDPNPSGTVDNLPAHYRAATNVSGSDQATAGKNLADDPLRKADVKLNTVTKSKLDWAKHVDSVGLQEELKDYSKAKEGYLTRMDFLNRVDERVDEGRRAAKTS